MPNAAQALRTLPLVAACIITAGAAALAGCGERNDADKIRAFTEGQRTLNRLEPVPTAARVGRDQKSVLGDDGATGETVQGATRIWKLTNPRQTNNTVLSHYAKQVRRFGYVLGTRSGDSNSSHRNWFRRDACIRVLVTNNRLVVLTAEDSCAGGAP